MSKKENKKLLKGKIINGIGDANPVKIVSNSINGKGKIRGNKKQKREVKAICNHYIYTRKGKLKPTIEPEGRGKCRCYICGDIVPMDLLQEGEIIKETKRVYDRVSQAAFMAQSLDAGKNVVAQITDTKNLLKKFPKTYTNLRKVAEKLDRTTKNKKKNKNHNGGSSSLGQWSINK